MTTEEVRLLTYNPFFGKNILHHFICGFANGQASINLIYLVFPLVFNESSRTILNTARKDSTLETSFLDTPKGKISLAGIEKRYEYFKDLTQKSTIILCSEKAMLIEKEFFKVLSEVSFKNEKDLLLKEYFRAAYYLGVIFSNSNSELDIFLKLRIKNI